MSRYSIIAIAMSFLINNSAISSNDKQYPNFTDPTIQYQTSPDWSSKAITYPSYLKGYDLYISLDQQQYPYLQPMIEEYAKLHNLKIKVDSGTCGISAGLLRKKAVDIGGYCCPPGKLDRLEGLKFHTIGIASLAIITHKNNPVNNVTLAQARAIFSGDITSWSSLSQTVKKSYKSITPIVRPHCKKRPGHWRLLIPHKNQFSTERFEVGAIPDMIYHTINRLGAIGYETLWSINNNPAIKVLTIDGINPNNVDALLSGSYPLYRTFSITTWEDAASNTLSDQLVAWIKKRVLPGNAQALVTTQQLRDNHWQFYENELIASPKHNKLNKIH